MFPAVGFIITIGLYNHNISIVKLRREKHFKHQLVVICNKGFLMFSPKAVIPATGLYTLKYCEGVIASSLRCILRSVCKGKS